MDKKKPQGRVETDQDDQYSRPDCRSEEKPERTKKLGPNTTQLLGILQSMQDKDA